MWRVIISANLYTAHYTNQGCAMSAKNDNNVLLKMLTYNTINLINSQCNLLYLLPSLNIMDYLLAYCTLFLAI